MGDCAYRLLLQFGLPCIHYLYRYRADGDAIPRSLCHPRWWVNGGPIIVRDWVPYDNIRIESEPTHPIFSSVERQLMEVRETLDSEGREQLDRRRARRQELVDEEMLQIAYRQLERQAVPIQPPEPVIKRNFIKAKAHGRADARGLTANEIAKRRQQQQARQEAESRRIADTRFIQGLQLAATADTQMSTITVVQAPTRPQTPPIAVSSQSLLSSPLPIRSSPIQSIQTAPATPERPRPRRTPTPEASPIPMSPPPASAYEAPSSTTPAELGRGKRKKPHTTKYQEARKTGEIKESQEIYKAEGRRG